MSPQIPGALPAHVSDTAAGTAVGHASLQGRRLLVVGGGQQTHDQLDPPVGIGRAISLFAAREGASVVVADIDPAAAQTTADRITQEGGTAHAVVGDSSNETDVARFIDEAVGQMGGLDAVSLNVGIAVGDRLADTTAADWDRAMAANLRSPFLCCKHTLPLLPPGAAIVLTSSTAARVVSTTDIPAYAASKAALSGLCAYVAKEAALRRVRVNVVMPGLIDTSLGRLASLVKLDQTPSRFPWAAKALDGMWLPLPCSSSPIPPTTSRARPSPLTEAFLESPRPSIPCDRDRPHGTLRSPSHV